MHSLSHYADPYWASVLVGASLVYKLTRTLISVLAPSIRASMVRWIRGEYENVWAHYFLSSFDTVFGDQHFSFSCFWRSLLATTLFATLLGVGGYDILIGWDTSSAGSNVLTLFGVIAVAICCSAIPDYVSLMQTRILLEDLRDRGEWHLQLRVVCSDLLATATIAAVPLMFFQNVLIAHTDGSRSTTALDVLMFGISSVDRDLQYAAAGFLLGFYTTFFTTMWSLLFGVSMFLMRAWSWTRLNKILNVEEDLASSFAFFNVLLVVFCCFLLWLFLQ